MDTDAAGTIDEVAATGFEALAVQLGDGGDTVTLDGNLGAGGAGLFAITVNGGLAGADGADIVDARTLSSATGIVFNGGAGSDRFVSSNAGGTDTFNGGADGVTGDTVDYSAVTGSGVTVNLSASGVNSTGAGNDTLINVENVIGTNQADTFTGSSDNNMFDGRGGAAVDQVNGYTGPGWQIRINAAGHWVVQNASGDVDELIDIEKVVINGTTYLLVDQQADGGFASVQAAIDAASGGEVILIAPGSYVESKVPAPHSLSAGGLFIDKPNLTLQGVKADGTPIDTAAGARDFGATIVSGAQTDFGANHLVAASGATIQGLHLKAGASTDNKLLEIWADGFQVLNSFVDTTRAGDVATTAVTIYINEVAGTQIDSYRIEGNILNKGIYVANGTGDAPGTIGTTQIIRGNTFTGDGSYDGSTNRFDAISVRGEEPGIGWQTQPAQVPLIEDNQRHRQCGPVPVPHAREGRDVVPVGRRGRRNRRRQLQRRDDVGLCARWLRSHQGAACAARSRWSRRRRFVPSVRGREFDQHPQSRARSRQRSGVRHPGRAVHAGRRYRPGEQRSGHLQPEPARQ